MAEVVYNIAKDRIAKGQLVFGTTVLKALLVITSKTGASDPDLATLAAIDAVGTVAFHTDRQTLTTVVATQDNANDRENIDSANIAFGASAGVTALAMIIYDATTDTTDTTRLPVAFYDTGFGAGLPIDGGLNVTVTDFLRIT
jgi:hypothetical protein